MVYLVAVANVHVFVEALVVVHGGADLRPLDIVLLPLQCDVGGKNG